LFALVTALLIPRSASAQRHDQGSACDGLSGAAWGLCNAFCETLDCDGNNTKAAPQACSRILANFTQHSDEPIPCAPVECPCFAPAAVDELVEYCREQSSPVECTHFVGVEPNGPGDLIDDIDITCFVPEPVNNVSLAAVLTSGFEDLFCISERVPGTPDNDLFYPDLTREEAAACHSILLDRIAMPPCDTIEYER
jgi:hypothetical protein